MPTYSFRDVKTSISGPGGWVLLGLGQDDQQGVAEEGISVERVEDRNSQLRGTSGEVINLLSASMAGVVRVRLLKTAPSNGVLMEMFKIQRGDGSRWSKNLISIEDKTRGDKLVAAEAAFMGEPVIVWGKIATVQEWVFLAGSIDETLAGVKTNALTE